MLNDSRLYDLFLHVGHQFGVPIYAHVRPDLVRTSRQSDGQLGKPETQQESVPRGEISRLETNLFVPYLQNSMRALAVCALRPKLENRCIYEKIMMV